MKTSLIILIIGLSLFLILGCSGPSEEEVAAKADEVVPRAQELMLLASFAPEAECRELAGEFAQEYEIDRMPYDDSDVKEAMSKLNKLDKGLDELEEDLEKAGCDP